MPMGKPGENLRLELWSAVLLKGCVITDWLLAASNLCCGFRLVSKA